MFRCRGSRYQGPWPWLAARSEVTYPARWYAEPAMLAGAASFPRSPATVREALALHPAGQPVEQHRGVRGAVPQQRGGGHHHVRAGQQVRRDVGRFSTPVLAASEARTRPASRAIQVRGSHPSPGGQPEPAR